MFSVGIFVGTTRGLTRRLGDVEKSIHEQGEKIQRLEVDLARAWAKVRQNGNQKGSDV